MESPPRRRTFYCSYRISFLLHLVLNLYVCGFSTYALWYQTYSEPLMSGCCELSEEQYRVLRDNYVTMTLRKLNQTGPLEYLPDCVILANATMQLAPQRCCRNRHLLSLTMPGDAFKVYERPLNCGYVACKDSSNRWEMWLSTFVICLLVYKMAYSSTTSEYALMRLMEEIRRRHALTASEERRSLPEPQAAPSVGR